MDDTLSKYFMPYQANYINDKRRFKIVEKSRRIGMTYAESFDNTADAALGKVQKVWFSSADLTASEEFIDYVAYWARVLDVAAKDMGEVVVDSDNDVLAHRVTFTNGSEINAISSNPSKFRSKGGRIILDEFAHHKNQEKLLAAAKPSTMWGSELRIISTHNGEESVFNQLIKEVNKGNEGSMKNWKLHKTTIDEAIKQGLVDKIIGHKASENEIAEFLEDAFSGMTQEAIQEEFYCIPRGNSSNHLLSYELINAVQRENILYGLLESAEGMLFVGYDIARRRDLSVIWIIEQLGEIYYTRQVIVLKNMKFRDQKKILYEILNHPKVRRCCIDETGIGMNLAEDAETDFGKYKVEPIYFTGKVKEEMANHTFVCVENQKVLIPLDKTIRDDLYSVKSVITTAGNVRYEAEHTEEGHADRFWSLSLALHAAKGYDGPPRFASGGKFETKGILKGFFNSQPAGRY